MVRGVSTPCFFKINFMLYEGCDFNPLVVEWHTKKEFIEHHGYAHCWQRRKPEDRKRLMGEVYDLIKSMQAHANSERFITGSKKDKPA